MKEFVTIKHNHNLAFLKNHVKEWSILTHECLIISYRTRETSDDRGGLVRRDGVKLLCSHVAVVVFTLSFEWTETYCRR